MIEQTKKDLHMPDSQISEARIAALVEEITRKVLMTVNSDEASLTIKTQNERKEIHRRRKSQYTGQLHLKVLQEDEDWFRSMVREYDVQNGKFFSLMRRQFEMDGENARLEFVSASSGHVGKRE